MTTFCLLVRGVMAGVIGSMVGAAVVGGGVGAVGASFSLSRD